MKELTDMLQRCDKKALVGVLKSLYMTLEDYQDDPEENAELHSDDVKGFIHRALFQMQVFEKHQQDKDRNAFTVVLGTAQIEAVAKPDFQVEAVGRERFFTGLLAVGGDVLSFISTFLSWEKVKLQREWQAPGAGTLGSCSISACSSMILSSLGPDLHLWDATSGRLTSALNGHTDHVWSCRFFPDGKTMVSASNDRTLKVWDVASGSLVKTMVGHTHFVTCVDVSPDNERILSGSLDGTWKMWNSTGELQHTKLGRLACRCCAFSPNGHLFLVGSGSNLRLHDSTTYQVQRVMWSSPVNGEDPLVMSCSFAPDGSTILSGGLHDMKLWSTTTGHHLRTLAGHSGYISSCFFPPNGHEICSASDGGALLMWTAATGQLEGIIDASIVDGDGSTIPRSICASSDGKYIASGYGHGSVKMWRVEWGKCSPEMDVLAWVEQQIDLMPATGRKQRFRNRLELSKTTKLTGRAPRTPTPGSIMFTTR
jgi:WD40 repeat protein